MHAESKSFSYLSEIQTFEVPFFQRAYAWKKDNWEVLFDDLIRVNQRHFLGFIILKRILWQNGISFAQSHALPPGRDITLQYALYAKNYNSSKFRDKKWNRTIPKIMDNMVIGYLKLHSSRRNKDGDNE